MLGPNECAMQISVVVTVVIIIIVVFFIYYRTNLTMILNLDC